LRALCHTLRLFASFVHLKHTSGAHFAHTMTLLHDFETVQAGLFTEADLLGPEASPDDASSQTNTHDHAVVTAPILTGDALDLLSTATFPQRALYGRVVSQHGNGVPARPENSRLFINTNAPFSALVCGVQVSEE
jgi:hypothetical protein